ncbi:MAG TPA: adenosine deaminase [Gemmatimonadales bacterium]|nr:adenosine deaminase [Gemmatimonadales bacterium]
MTVTREWLARLPKAELHTHLDGCLRPSTLLELADQAGVRPPGDTPDAVADALHVRHARNLDEYLERYVATVSVMRSPAALARIARELVEDAAAEGVRYLEARFCPALHGPEVALAEALEAVLDGLATGQRATGTVARLIACGLRVLPPETSLAIARAATRYAGRGVVAFDLAGAEAGHPAGAHAEAFRVAREGGLHITCHAGEAAGPESIRAALDACGAERLGHGVRLREDPALEAEVADRGVPLEMCLTSNVHTRAVRRLEDHPARRYLHLGIPVTLNTDSRLMDRTTLTHELWMAHTTLGFTAEELVRVTRNGFAHAFLPDDERRRLLAAVGPALEGAA